MFPCCCQLRTLLTLLDNLKLAGELLKLFLVFHLVCWCCVVVICRLVSLAI